MNFLDYRPPLNPHGCASEATSRAMADDADDKSLLSTTDGDVRPRESPFSGGSKRNHLETGLSGRKPYLRPCAPYATAPR